jgi:hypothetical protein
MPLALDFRNSCDPVDLAGVALVFAFEFLLSVCVAVVAAFVLCVPIPLKLRVRVCGGRVNFVCVCVCVCLGTLSPGIVCECALIVLCARPRETPLLTEICWCRSGVNPSEPSGLGCLVQFHPLSSLRTHRQPDAFLVHGFHAPIFRLPRSWQRTAHVLG